MPINMQQIDCINDNPNLSSSAMGKFLGLKPATVSAIRSEYDAKQKWKHSGKGVPFLTAGVSGGGINYKVRCKNRTVVSCSSLTSAMENLDRLIYCLENDGGNIIMTFEESILNNLDFIKG